MAIAKEKHARKKELLSLIDGGDPESSPDLADWQKELDVILLKEAEIVKIKSGVKYIEEGEKCTAFLCMCKAKSKSGKH